MNTNPYKITDLEKALLRVPKSNIPQFLEVIFLSRDYATLTSTDKDKLISELENQLLILKDAVVRIGEKEAQLMQSYELLKKEIEG